MGAEVVADDPEQAAGIKEVPSISASAFSSHP